MLLPHIKFFKKTKGCLELVSLAHFLHGFWRKIFFLLYSITWPNLIGWLLLLRKILGSICIVIVCSTGCAVINFEINLIFLIKALFLYDQKSTQKFKNLENEKSFYNKINSIFHHFSKVFIEANKTTFLEDESPTLITLTAMSKGFNRLQLRIIDYRFLRRDI